MSEGQDAVPCAPRSLLYSAIMPVFNSQDLVGTTIDRIVAFFEEHSLDYEVVCVVDGSPDESWEVVRQKAEDNPNVKAINLLKNYGQHTAVFCGLQACRGDYAITLDDDLQNPPEEMLHLIGKAAEGYDLVFGRFHQKKHGFVRRIGSYGIGQINQRIFGQPKDLVLTNFRIIRRDVIDRMCAYRTPEPYIPGLSLMFSHKRANVGVEHKPRPEGKSNYNILRIWQLIMRILFNYSAVPLRVVSGLGVIVSITAFLIGLFLVARYLLTGTAVPGWTSLVVLLSIFNGFTVFLLSMLGEYMVRLITQTSSGASYYVKDAVNTELE